MSFFHPRRNRRVRFHLREGAPSIDGVLVGRVDKHYIVWNAKVVLDEEQTQPVSGHVEVPERNVLFIQILG